MQTKFNVDDIVYSVYDNFKIRKVRIYVIEIRSDETYGIVDVKNKSNFGYLEKDLLFATFEEARQYLIKDKTAEYQQDIEEILALKEEEVQQE